MISKSKLKFIRSLSLKKIRDTEDAFLAEGPKVVSELAAAFPCRMLVGRSDYLAGTHGIVADEIVEVSQEELERCSQMRMPQHCLAVFGRKRVAAQQMSAQHDGLTLVLDDIQDPGNLGTIIRTCDWFGIRQIVCSANTADAFQPKVVQATMGALARVDITYTDLPDFFSRCPADISIYGTFLNGENLFTAPIENRRAVIVMGNEGHGISREAEAYIDRRLFIPNYPPGEVSGESLNVSIATAITLAEFRRRKLV